VTKVSKKSSIISLQKSKEHIMANYLQLKKQFNSNKKFIKQVLNDQKCQLRLQAEGLSTLNNY
jgi:ribosomal protein S17E